MIYLQLLQILYIVTLIFQELKGEKSRKLKSLVMLSQTQKINHTGFIHGDFILTSIQVISGHIYLLFTNWIYTKL